MERKSLLLIGGGVLIVLIIVVVAVYATSGITYVKDPDMHYYDMVAKSQADTPAAIYLGKATTYDAAAALARAGGYNFFTWHDATMVGAWQYNVHASKTQPAKRVAKPGRQSGYNAAVAKW